MSEHWIIAMDGNPALRREVQQLARDSGIDLLHVPHTHHYAFEKEPLPHYACTICGRTRNKVSLHLD